MAFVPRRRYGALKRKAGVRKLRFRRKRLLRYSSVRPVASRVHIIKRLGQDIAITTDVGSSNPGGPTLAYSGAGSAFLGSIGHGSLAGTWSAGGALQFKLSSVVDPGDLTSLFDRYKIVGVKLKCLFMQNTSDTAGGSMLPVMYYAQDNDDCNVPTTETEVVVKGFCKTKVLSANRPFSIYLKPKVTKQIDGVDPSTGLPVALGLSSERAPFIDCAYQNVPHFGLKFWIDYWTGINIVNTPEPKVALKIQPIYYLAMKDTQ